MILTRYLYNHFQVKCSIFLSLLDREKDETLFWCYEMYYSGFQECVFEYLIELYNTLYITRKTISDELNKMYGKWKDERENDFILGEIVCNLLNYKYSICKFVKKFDKKIKCKENKEKNKYVNKYVTLSQEENEQMIHMYSTKRNCKYYWKTMKDVCRFKIRNNMNTICKEPILYNNLDWSHNWLKYVLNTPIWQHRIEKYNGTYDSDRMTVNFESIDDSEEFHNHYDLEPDEQSKQIQINCLGDVNDLQYTNESLIEKYGGIIE